MVDDLRRSGAETLATPTNPLADASVAFVRERFDDAMVEVIEHRGETTIVVRPERIVDVCLALRDAPTLHYNFLVDVTAVDWLEREPRYDVVYHLLSLDTYAALRVKTRVGDEATPEPELPSVTSVWAAADWYEREVYDLFGIRFTGHATLTRIVLPPDWVGHPLRKDYPLSGFQLPDPHWGGQIPLTTPLPSGIGEQTMRTTDGSEHPNRPGRPQDGEM